MKKHLDGDIYKRITVFGVSFELKYGYYEEYERQSGEPVPIYPDFIGEPMYTKDGQPFVTAMQNACMHFSGEDKSLGCYGCKHFSEGEDLIGICRNDKRRDKEPHRDF